MAYVISINSSLGKGRYLPSLGAANVSAWPDSSIITRGQPQLNTLYTRSTDDWNTTFESTQPILLSSNALLGNALLSTANLTFDDVSRLLTLSTTTAKGEPAQCQVTIPKPPVANTLVDWNTQVLNKPWITDNTTGALVANAAVAAAGYSVMNATGQAMGLLPYLKEALSGAPPPGYEPVDPTANNQPLQITWDQISDRPILYNKGSEVLSSYLVSKHYHPGELVLDKVAK
eukprot:jgi/Chrzof1/14268/Cz08g31200.t1